MMRPKDLSDNELLDIYISTKQTIESIKNYLDTITFGTQPDYAETEIELIDEEGYLNELAHEMIDRLLQRR